VTKIFLAAGPLARLINRQHMRFYCFAWRKAEMHSRVINKHYIQGIKLKRPRANCDLSEQLLSLPIFSIRKCDRAPKTCTNFMCGDITNIQSKVNAQ